MASKRLSQDLQLWADARRRHRLSHAHVAMARELGMNPKKMGKIDNHRAEPWKAPLPIFIETLYQKRFGRERPETIRTIEEVMAARIAKKAAKKARKDARQTSALQYFPEEGIAAEPYLRIAGVDRMQPPPISQAEIDARIEGHIDELLELWWAEQGAGKLDDLALIASALPFPREGAIRVLDLCCGPGDVGRAIHRLYANADIDGIDRDPFLMSICRAANGRDRIPGKLVVRDLEEDGWLAELRGDYDVVATVNALHWFDAARAEQIVRDVHGTLLRGGAFILAEPVSPEPPFAAGFEEWKTKHPPRYSRENWERFWSRANALLGYDHPALWGPRDDSGIGDGLSVAEWIRLVERAGFALIDVLLRDADQVVIGALKETGA